MLQKTFTLSTNIDGNLVPEHRIQLLELFIELLGDVLDLVRNQGHYDSVLTKFTVPSKLWIVNDYLCYLAIE